MFRLPNNDNQRDQRERLLVDAVRAEIRAGVEPLARDLASVREAVERLEAAQQEMYTREVMDLKLKERDERINTLESQLASTNKAVGSLWQNAATKVGVVFALIISLWDVFDATGTHLHLF